MATLLVRDNWGDQMHVQDSPNGAQIMFLGPRGGLKGVMDLSGEQVIALAEFLAPQLSREFLAGAHREGKKVNQ